MKYLPIQLAYLTTDREARINLRALARYLPFLFIRPLYAPWLEARVRQRAPRSVPRGTHGRVIIPTCASSAGSRTNVTWKRFIAPARISF